MMSQEGSVFNFGPFLLLFPSTNSPLKRLKCKVPKVFKLDAFWTCLMLKLKESTLARAIRGVRFTITNEKSKLQSGASSTQNLLIVNRASYLYQEPACKQPASNEIVSSKF